MRRAVDIFKVLLNSVSEQQKQPPAAANSAVTQCAERIGRNITPSKHNAQNETKQFILLLLLCWAGLRQATGPLPCRCYCWIRHHQRVPQICFGKARYHIEFSKTAHAPAVPCRGSTFSLIGHRFKPLGRPPD